MTNQRLQELFQSYLEDRLGSADLEELRQVVGRDEYTETVEGLLEKAYANPAFAVSSDYNIREVFAELMEKVNKRNAVVVPMKKRVWVKWAAAAVIVFAVGGLWFLRETSNVRREKKELAKTNDVPAPTNTRAVITLADGSKVYLDSAGHGTIAEQNNVAVVKNSNGEIVYSSEKRVASSELVYNTLTNPRGSKVISLTLSDGTRVWLNAESSLRYPASFASSAVNREVEITGEAYFEVKHDAKQPFKVHLPNGSVIEDIGTSFNVNAYPDESDIKTTLIEGSINVFASAAKSAAPFAFKLKPGQQAVINNPSNNLIEANKNENPLDNPVIRVQDNVNISQIMSWRNNKFYFESADIHSIARQLSRWYDVDVEVRDNIPSHFTGIINRDVKVSQVFEMLQKTGAVKFSVEGKKIVITK
jgi:ferric-dicitrate binding protein FerR (iron transport regulator)